MKILNSIICFAGTLISSVLKGTEVHIIIERPTGESRTETDRVIFAWADEAEATVCHEQFTQGNIIGKTILALGEYIENRTLKEDERVVGTVMELEEFRIIGKTFGEAVREAALKLPLGLTLECISDWNGVAKWFSDIHKALFNKKYSLIMAEGVKNTIARGHQMDNVAIPLTLPSGKATLIGVTQDPTALDSWGQMAASGEQLSWYGFKVEPTTGATNIVRAGRVEKGEFIWNEGARELLAALFISPKAKIDLKNIDVEMPRNAADALANAALEQVRSPVSVS